LNLCKDVFTLIFPEFPREVVFVKENVRARKRIVRSFSELTRVSSIYGGLYNVYTKLYVGNTLNKVFFDIDAENIYDAFNDAIGLGKVLERENLLYIPVFSGKKGFHFYVMSNQFNYSSDEVPLAKYILSSVQNYFIEEASLKHVDKHFIGSLTRLTRVPNTKRDNQRYAIYLPQRFWEKYDLPEIVEMSYVPRCFSIENYCGEKLDFYEYSSIHEYDFDTEHDFDPSCVPEIDLSKCGKKDIYLLLDQIIRPCILYRVFTDDPEHDIRTFFVLELKYYYFSQKEVEEIISKLGWQDYDSRITHYHVSKLFEKKLYPPKCATIRERGYCLGKKCQFYPGLFMFFK